MSMPATTPSGKASYPYRSYACYLSCLLFWLSAPALSAGIATMEQSVKELGQAISGAPVNTDDGSMVFFNPGAMNQVRGKLVSVAGYAVVPSTTFQDNSSHLNPSQEEMGGIPILGNNGGNVIDPIFMPSFYYVHEVTKRLALGLGANVPFGVRSSYHPDWKGRYQAIDSEITVLNINPSLSLQLTEKLSFGAGFNVQYLHARLTNAIDLWSDLFSGYRRNTVHQSGAASTNCGRSCFAQRRQHRSGIQLWRFLCHEPGYPFRRQLPVKGCARRAGQSELLRTR